MLKALDMIAFVTVGSSGLQSTYIFGEALLYADSSNIWLLVHAVPHGGSHQDQTPWYTSQSIRHESSYFARIQWPGWSSVSFVLFFGIYLPMGAQEHAR